MEKSLKHSSFLALAGALLAYCATPWFGFVFDDRKQVLANPSLLHPGAIPGYFAHAGGYLAGDLSYYRPLFGAWMNLNYFVFGLHPWGWHAALLGLHVLAVFLCYRVVRAITQDPGVAVVAALLFAVHPVHVESVAWISGGTDPLAAIFILLAFLFYLRSQTNWRMTNWKIGILSWLAFAASLLCKETALLFPLLILVHGLFLGKDARRRATALKQSAPYFVVAAIYLVVRIQVMGAFSHTLTALSPAVLVLTLPSVAFFYARLLFFPAGLSPFYDTPYVKAATLSGFVVPVLALLAIAALLAWWIRGLRRSDGRESSRSPQVIFFAAWTVLFLVPAFNLSALDAGEIAHDRYLYLPSLGFCALAAIALRQLAERLRLSEFVRIFALAGLGVILCAATIAQSGFWKDDLSLYKRGAGVAPGNINAQNNLANIYLETGDFEQGIAAHQRILKLNPRYVDSYFNLGLAYYNLGDFAQSQAYLQQAISLRPTAQAYFYLGLAQFKKGDLPAAEQSLQTAARLDQGRPDFHAALGVLYETENKLPPALQELEQALSLNPQNMSIRNEVAKVKGRLGQAQ
jgi:tetratricopeptide (TPR) repeat protein